MDLMLLASYSRVEFGIKVLVYFGNFLFGKLSQTSSHWGLDGFKACLSSTLIYNLSQSDVKVNKNNGQ